MRSGCEAWLMLFQLLSHMVAMEADMCARVGEGSAGSAEPSHWENMVAEYADVFELPGMPADRDTMHHIKVEPGSEPPFRQQYRVSTQLNSTLLNSFSVVRPYS